MNQRIKKLFSYSIFSIVISVLAFVISYTITCGAYPDTYFSDNSENCVALQNEPLNILVLGEDDAAGLTDVIMLVSFDTKNGEMNILQIPRDTYAEYTTAAYRKLNAASDVLGGGEKLKIFLSESLGVKIDRYLELNLNTVADVVDKLGGVDVDVPTDMTYTDPNQNLIINIPEGKQHLNGKMAEHFLRFREGYVRGDLGRMDAQKIFLAALANKLSETKILSLIDIAVSVLPKVDTDVTYDDCVEIINGMYKIIPGKVKLMTLPGGDIQGSSGAWYYIMNRKASFDLLKTYFSPTLSEDTFDRNYKFTSRIRNGFNEIYDANEGYETRIYSVDDVNGGINIQTKKG